MGIDHRQDASVQVEHAHQAVASVWQRYDVRHRQYAIDAPEGQPELSVTDTHQQCRRGSTLERGDVADHSAFDAHIRALICTIGRSASLPYIQTLVSKCSSPLS